MDDLDLIAVSEERAVVLGARNDLYVPLHGYRSIDAQVPDQPRHGETIGDDRDFAVDQELHAPQVLH